MGYTELRDAETRAALTLMEAALHAHALGDYARRERCLLSAGYLLGDGLELVLRESDGVPYVQMRMQMPDAG